METSEDDVIELVKEAAQAAKEFLEALDDLEKTIEETRVVVSDAKIDPHRPA